MVELKMSMDGYEVYVDKKRFGQINKEYGFFISKFMLCESDGPIEVKAKDLITIAIQVDSIKLSGHPKQL